MLIGVVGFIGSGKGTVGKYLSDEVYNFRKDSFAKPLKDSVSIIFGWERDLLEGETEMSRAWREVADPYWSEIIGEDFTPRLALQKFGTECIRDVFHPDVWSSSLIKRWLSSNRSPTVVTDCRFRNEISAIQKVGGKVWRVRRGEDPEWYDEYLDLYNDGLVDEIEQLRKVGVFPHSSETDWIGSEFDEIIENNGTLDDLYRKIDTVLNYYYDENVREVS